MTRGRTFLAVAAGVLVSGLLALATMWLATDNPEIERTSRGTYTCDAPYDVVLNDADSFPGGEPPADKDDIMNRCKDAATNRFYVAAASGVATVVALIVTVVIVVRRED